MSMHTLMLDERPLVFSDELRRLEKYASRMFWACVTTFVCCVSLFITLEIQNKRNASLNQEVLRLKIELRELKEMRQ